MALALKDRFDRKTPPCLANAQILGSRRLQPLRAAHLPPLQNNVSRAGGALFGLSQWEGEKEGISFDGARRMNAATQTAGQLADDRSPRPRRMGSGAEPLSATLHFTTWPASSNSTRNSGCLASNCACRATLVSSSDTISPSFQQRSPSSRRSSDENKTRIARRSSRYFVMEKQSCWRYLAASVRRP